MKINFKSLETKIVLGVFFIIISFFIKKIDENLSVVIILLAYIFISFDIIIKAFHNLRYKNFLDENFLMSIATIGAICIGEVREAFVVILFYNIGELLQRRAIAKSRKSISDLMNIKAEYANLVVDNKVTKIDPSDLNIGDVIQIKPGEKIPIDSTVIDGSSLVDTSSLTGESKPVKVKIGDNILSGCINIEGVLSARVVKDYYDSVVNKILDLVENASTKKSSSEKFITKFSKIYTPLVVLLAIFIAIIPPIFIDNYDFKKWIFKSLAFLVVSCPCAFIISVPMAFFCGIGVASREGILIKGGNYLELLTKIKTIIFDKTGTLTHGIFKVKDIIVLNNNFSKKDILKFAAYAESFSIHPIAKSIQNSFNQDIDKNKIKNWKEISGKGISANIFNRKIYIGNDKLINVPKEILNINGNKIYMSIDNELVGYIIIGDEIKKDAYQTIKKLKNLNINMVMLTGDTKNNALEVSRELNIDEVYFHLLPNEKVDILEKIIKKSFLNQKVAFVGDGINDAPAISISDIGLAMGGIGSDAAIEAADIVIMNDDLSKIPTAINIAKLTIKIAKQNVFVAIFIKTLALLLSLIGIATMWEAVFADVGVTIITILNSLRILKFKELKPEKI